MSLLLFGDPLREGDPRSVGERFGDSPRIGEISLNSFPTNVF